MRVYGLMVKGPEFSASGICSLRPEPKGLRFRVCGMRVDAQSAYNRYSCPGSELTGGLWICWVGMSLNDKLAGYVSQTSQTKILPYTAIVFFP